MENTPEKPVKQNNPLKPVLIILIIMIVLLGGAGGYLAFQYMQSGKKYEALKMEKIQADSTISQQNKELEQLKHEVDSLMGIGGISQAEADSLYGVIDQLQTDLAAAKSSRVVYSGGGGNKTKEIEALKEELNSIKADNEKLRAQVTSLTGERDTYKTQVTTLDQEKNDLSVRNKNLQDKVDLASQLRFSETLLSSYKLNKKGVKSLEEKAKKVMGFEVSFKVLDNPIAEEGERTAYIVINGPNKKVMTESTANVFNVGGVDKVYSIRKTFYFSKKQALISADYKTGENLKTGEYTAEIYVDGVLISTAVTYLK